MTLVVCFHICRMIFFLFCFEQLDIDADMPQQLYRKLEEIEQSFHKKFENSS